MNHFLKHGYCGQPHHRRAVRPLDLEHHDRKIVREIYRRLRRNGIEDYNARFVILNLVSIGAHGHHMHTLHKATR